MPAHSETVDTIVIGAGVIGLAIARHLARTGREVLVLEANAAIGMETSSRNSGVIHAGIYYPPHSLKAHCCIRGNSLLYEYCAQRHIAHARCGKLIIASTPQQQTALAALQRNAVSAGANGLKWLDRAAVEAMEPEVVASAALFSPTTGIIDAHELMFALLADTESAGGTLITRSKVLSGKSTTGGIELQVDSGGETTLIANHVINAAGHGATAIARKIRGLPTRFVPAVYAVRGHYYEHTGKLPFSHLVYPLPGATGLGIHATVDLAGQGRFGPDSSYCDQVDYRFDESRKAIFTEAIRHWYPGLEESRLQPGYVGVRPTLQGPGEAASDFMISTPAEHGVDGLINLFGIESPGLTACLALAEKVAAVVERESSPR